MRVGYCRDVEDVVEELEQNPLYNDGMVARAILTDSRRILSVNTLFEEIFGYGRSELIDRSSQLFYPSAGAYEQLGKTAYPQVRNGEIYRGEQILIRKDGTPVCVRLTGRWLEACSEELYLWMLDDISKEKELTEALRHTSRFHAANPNVVFSVDARGRPEDLNPGAVDWLKKNDFQTETALLHICPEDLLDVVELAIRDQQHYSRQITFRERHYRFQLSPFFGDERCYVNVIDETEQQRLLRENLMFRASFRSATQAMIMTSVDGAILHVNDEFLNLYGYTEGEVIGANPRILNAGYEEYANEGFSREQVDLLFRGMWQTILDPKRGHWQGELINRSKDGTLRWVELYVSRISGASGELIAFLGLPLDVTQRLTDERSVRLEYCNAITELAETRDNETGSHIKRIAIFSGMLARGLKLPEKLVREIETFAPHHDIGKVGVPDAILLAPRKLTPEEFQVMKGHTLHGYRILNGKKTLEVAAEIAYCHHERWDGGGYPRGMKGTEIPLSARIVAVADVYDALRSPRPYKEAWSHTSALGEIRRECGHHFDPAVVDAMVSIGQDYAAVYAANSPARKR
ncbi:MAG: HD domain-containing phosphohydrolase [Alkalispirochaeta sp.]